MSMSNWHGRHSINKNPDVFTRVLLMAPFLLNASAPSYSFAAQTLSCNNPISSQQCELPPPLPAQYYDPNAIQTERHSSPEEDKAGTPLPVKQKKQEVEHSFWRKA